MSRLDNFFNSRWVNAIGGFVVGGIVVAMLKSSPYKPPVPVNLDIARADWVTVCVGKMAGGNFPKPEVLKNCADAAMILMPVSPSAPAVSQQAAGGYEPGDARVSVMATANPEKN